MDEASLIHTCTERINSLINLGENLHDSLIAYIRFFTEIIFERERATKFPELPSRNNCIWLTQRNELKKWMALFNSVEPLLATKYKIFKVKAYGIIHKTDGLWMTPDIYTVTEIFERARKYWSGEFTDNKKESLIEYLFSGKLEIQEEIKISEI